MAVKSKEYPVVLFHSSTAVVQVTVNHLVVGSIPACGAIYVALDFWWGHHPFKVTRGDRNPYATPYWNALKEQTGAQLRGKW